MPNIPEGLLGWVAAMLTIIGVLGVALSNILYSRPRIDKQAAELRDLRDSVSTLQAINAEKDKRINFLEEMVKSVPAFGELVQAMTQMQLAVTRVGSTKEVIAALEIHERRSAERDAKLIEVLQALTARIEHREVGG